MERDQQGALPVVFAGGRPGPQNVSRLLVPQSHDMHAGGDGSAACGVVIVDTSYMVFAKWYSALSWYRASVNRNPEIGSLMKIDLFRKKVSQMFEDSLARVVLAGGMAGAYVVFAKDCQRSAVWRKNHFRQYKQSRVLNDSFSGDVFGFVYDVVIPKVLSESRGCVIGADGAEADDVIGVLSKHLAGSGRRVLIVSNDNDCIQLASEGTTVVNLFMQDVGGRRGDLTPEQYLRARILSGDRSDNIPSIVHRCGTRLAARMAVTYAEGELRDMCEGYDLNDLLMNLDRTPASIREDVVSRFVLEEGRVGAARDKLSVAVSDDERDPPSDD